MLLVSQINVCDYDSKKSIKIRTQDYEELKKLGLLNSNGPNALSIFAAGSIVVIDDNMTRVHERHTSAGPSAANRHRRSDQNRKTSYKVILEEVADKQKRLRTVVCGSVWAPTSA